MSIKDYKNYKGILISRDYDVIDSEQVYIGNGQGCHTFWFKSVSEAKEFIDHYRDKIKVTDLGCIMGIIPREVCQTCQRHYSFGSKDWNGATRDNCQDVKESLKKF